MTDTPESLRQRAADRDSKNAERYREDELGLSMWADGLGAQQDRLQATILEAGGVWTFERTILCTLDGEVVEDARMCDTRYGLKWRSDSLDMWAPYRPARESTLAKRGLKEVTVTEVGEARAEMWAPPGARGLSGATSVRVIIRRTDKRYGEHWRPVGPPSK
jgi:hypothetical protein